MHFLLSWIFFILLLTTTELNAAKKCNPGTKVLTPKLVRAESADPSTDPAIKLITTQDLITEIINEIKSDKKVNIRLAGDAPQKIIEFENMLKKSLEDHDGHRLIIVDLVNLKNDKDATVVMLTILEEVEKAGFKVHSDGLLNKLTRNENGIIDTKDIINTVYGLTRFSKENKVLFFLKNADILTSPEKTMKRLHEKILLTSLDVVINYPEATKVSWTGPLPEHDTKLLSSEDGGKAREVGKVLIGEMSKDETLSQATRIINDKTMDWNNSEDLETLQRAFSLISQHDIKGVHPISQWFNSIKKTNKVYVKPPEGKVKESLKEISWSAERHKHISPHFAQDIISPHTLAPEQWFRKEARHEDLRSLIAGLSPIDALAVFMRSDSSKWKWTTQWTKDGKQEFEVLIPDCKIKGHQFTLKLGLDSEGKLKTAYPINLLDKITTVIVLPSLEDLDSKITKSFPQWLSDFKRLNINNPFIIKSKTE